ncbi:MAG: hypothetical protein JEY91_18515 [Spirochaetaceae bacterium]|nr:hypothetical protein [Spirochaetaceae bacterium]
MTAPQVHDQYTSYINGGVTSITQTTVQNSNIDSTKFTYGGKELDEEINLYYFNARYYDATTGRFINVDPIQDGTNWYVYCNNNPLNKVDPTGLSFKDIVNYVKNDWNSTSSETKRDAFLTGATVGLAIAGAIITGGTLPVAIAVVTSAVTVTNFVLNTLEEQKSKEEINTKIETLQKSNDNLVESNKELTNQNTETSNRLDDLSSRMDALESQKTIDNRDSDDSIQMENKTDIDNSKAEEKVQE